MLLSLFQEKSTTMKFYDLMRHCKSKTGTLLRIPGFIPHCKWIKQRILKLLRNTHATVSDFNTDGLI